MDYSCYFTTTDPAETYCGGTRLGLAIKFNDLPELRRLMARGAQDLNASCVGDSPPLVAAAEMGRMECLAILLADPRVDPECQDRDGRSAVQAAAWEGRLDVLMLLATRCDLRTEAENGMSALSAAAVSDQLGCVEFLAGRVDPAARDSSGLTPLMHAARGGALSVLRFLLPISDLSTRDQKGESPLMKAALRCDFVLVAELLPHFDPREKNREGLTALDLALKRAELGPRLEPDMQATVELLQAGDLALSEKAEIEAALPAASTNAPHEARSSRVRI